MMNLIVPSYSYQCLGLRSSQDTMQMSRLEGGGAIWHH